MIDPMTPAGTKIICINDDYRTFRVPNIVYDNDLDGLTKGNEYTLVEIFPTDDSNKTLSKFMVCVAEIYRHGFNKGFAIERFDYKPSKELPKEISEYIIKNIKVKEKEDA